MSIVIQSLINGLSLGGVYATIAVGFALIFNILKFSNFSHGGVLVVTAYAGYLIQKTLNTNFWLTLLLTALFGGLLALVIESTAFRRLRVKKANVMLYFVSSITMGTLLENVIAVLFGDAFVSYPSFFDVYFFRWNGIVFIVTDLMQLAISLIVLGLIMFVLFKTRLGVSIRALSMDSDTAKLMGVNVSQVMALTFFISGMLAATAGVLCGMKFVLYPQLKDLVMKGMTASILGGLGNISGALYGGLLLGLLEISMTHFFGSSLAPACTFLFAIIFLLFRPQGISGKFVKEKV